MLNLKRVRISKRLILLVLIALVVGGLAAAIFTERTVEPERGRSLQWWTAAAAVAYDFLTATLIVAAIANYLKLREQVLDAKLAMTKQIAEARRLRVAAAGLEANLLRAGFRESAHERCAVEAGTRTSAGARAISKASTAVGFGVLLG
jgi:hypothetical protein